MYDVKEERSVGSSIKSTAVWSMDPQFVPLVPDLEMGNHQGHNGGECGHGPHLARGMDGRGSCSAETASGGASEVLHHLAEQQRSMLKQLVTAQAQTNQHLWDHLAQK